MTGVDQLLALLRAASQRFTDLTGSLSAEQLRAASYADEWSNAQVASHLGSAAEIFGLLLAAGRTGDPPPPPELWQQVWDRWNALGPEQQVAESVRAQADLIATVETLDPGERERFRVEAFGTTLDLAGLIGMRLSEQTIHGWDVAVSQDAGAILAPDGVAELIDGLGPLAAWLPPVPGLAPVTVVTTYPDRRFRLGFDPTRTIEPATDSEPDVTDGDAEPPLMMPAEAFIRLIYGRLDPAHAPGVPDDPRLPPLRAAFTGF